MSKIFKTATAFRKSLESRLMNISQETNIDLQRLRRKVAFDRLLARFFVNGSNTWVLKGGYALEIRFAHARATKDIDLTLPIQLYASSESEYLMTMLQEESHIELGDYFTFAFRPAIQELDGAPEGGFRFPVEAIMDGRPFVKFHVDIGIGDILVEPVEKIIGENWLEFAGISPAIIYAISREQQFAEKLHAYTLPRTDRFNTRVKDLVDMLVLIRDGSVNEEVARESLHKVFHRRNTHGLPDNLPLPPDNWNVKFDSLAKECGMNESLDQAMEIVDRFYRKAIASDSLNDALLS
jgi:hypothetical protein